MKIYIIAFMLLYLYANNADGQNIVVNLGFESYSHCPIGISQGAADFGYAVNNWMSPNGGTSDYYNTCAATSLFGSSSIPHTGTGYQQTHNGNAFAGLLASVGPQSTYREFIKGQLSQPLTPGKLYKVDYFVSPGAPDTGTFIEYACYFTDGIGANFENITTGTHTLVQNTQGNIISDTAGWTNITGYMIGNAEQVITIGNYRSNSQTTLAYFRTVMQGAPLKDTFCYLFIDDVSVTEENVQAASHDTTICDTAGLVLSLIAAGGCTHYHLSTGDTTASIITSHTGTYWYTALYQSYPISDTIKVKYQYHQTLPNLLDTTVCEGIPVTVNTKNSFNSYSWQTTAGETGSSYSFTVRKAGTVYVAVNDICGLQRDSFVVRYTPLPPAPVVTDTTVCLGATITHLPVNGENLRWSISITDTIGSANFPNVRVDTVATQRIYVSQSNMGCIGQWAVLKINFIPKLEATLSLPDTVLCKGVFDSLSVTTSQTTGILWSTGEITPTIFLTNTGLYTVTTTNTCESVNRNADITIKDCSNSNTPCSVHLPNAFTPNNDGKNDNFGPVLTCPSINVEAYTLYIFDRWGKRVFFTNNINEYWSGNYKSVACPAEVYFYLLQVSYKNGLTTHIYKGDVTLIK